MTLAVVLVGVGFAYREYATREIPDTAPDDVSALTVAARNDLYGDAFDEAVLMRPGQGMVRTLSQSRTPEWAAQSPESRLPSGHCRVGCGDFRPASSGRMPCTCSPVRPSWLQR